MNIELIAMVYRSEVFLEFIGFQLKNMRLPYRVVLNDPTPEVQANAVGGWYNYEIYNDPRPDDYYLSRVYRCWNYCVRSSEADAVCLLNSDMALSPGWLDPLIREYEKGNTPVSRLVEPGFIGVGTYGIEVNIGRDPRGFPWESWRLMAKDLAVNEVHPGGLFMPCLIDRNLFLKTGLYPEGNMVIDGKLRSGDDIAFEAMTAAGRPHVTCFDSLVYHMQEGEMRFQG